MRIKLDLDSIDSYRLFLRIKALPSYRFVGREAWIPDEYAGRLGIEPVRTQAMPYEPWPGMFDYQRDITRLAIERGKFAVFAECGLGKSFCFLDFARHISRLLPAGQCILIVSPLMVIRQTIMEAERWYGDKLGIEHVKASELTRWLTSGTGRIGITNYEALKESVPQGRLGALIADESSTMKSFGGKWGTNLIRLGKGLRFKLALTGTPAPNDRIEFANHSVFLDAFPTVNSFLARFFVNRGQTQNRWEMKPYAIRSFYNALSHWCIFLTDPATYGWQDNAGSPPPIITHIHDVDLTAEQQEAGRETTGTLFPVHMGGITSRSKLARIAKGSYNGGKVETNKPGFIKSLVESWPDESTIIWCKYNDEQETIARQFPGAANISGATPQEQRGDLIEDFKAGRRKVLVSKGDIVGFGLNLQVCTRQVFSSLHDSWEEYHQCVKRSNRYGSTLPLNVHIPITDMELPMVETVLRKANRIQADVEEQERLFKDIVFSQRHGVRS